MSSAPSNPPPGRKPRSERSHGPVWRRPLRAVAELPRVARRRARTVVRRSVPQTARDAFVTDLTSMLLAGLYAGCVFPFVNIIARRDLHASPEVLGFMAAAPFLGNLCSLLWARAMEGRRKIPFVLYSHLAARSLVVTMALATGPWPFALIISGAQIIGTIATPAYAAIIKEVYPDDQRGRIMSMTRAVFVVAQILATFVAGWLLTRISYRVVFPLAALLGIAAAIVFRRIVSDEPEPAPEPRAAAPIGRRLRETTRYLWETLGILKVDRAYRWFAFSVFTYGFGNLILMPIYPLVQVDQLGMRTDDLAHLQNLAQIVAVLAYFYWGRYVDRRSPQRAVTVNILLNAWIPIVYIQAMAVGEAWVLLPAFLISGVVMAGIDLSYFNALLGFAREQNVARYQALQSFLLGLRGTVAPFIGSGLVRALDAHRLDRRWAFVIALVFILAGCWMQIVATRRHEAMRRAAAASSSTE